MKEKLKRPIKRHPAPLYSLSSDKTVSQADEEAIVVSGKTYRYRLTKVELEKFYTTYPSFKDDVVVTTENDLSTVTIGEGAFGVVTAVIDDNGEFSCVKEVGADLKADYFAALEAKNAGTILSNKEMKLVNALTVTETDILDLRANRLKALLTDLQQRYQEIQQSKKVQNPNPLQRIKAGYNEALHKPDTKNEIVYLGQTVEAELKAIQQKIKATLSPTVNPETNDLYRFIEAAITQLPFSGIPLETDKDETKIALAKNPKITRLVKEWELLFNPTEYNDVLYIESFGNKLNIATDNLRNKTRTEITCNQLIESKADKTNPAFKNVMFPKEVIITNNSVIQIMPISSLRGGMSFLSKLNQKDIPQNTRMQMWIDMARQMIGAVELVHKTDHVHFDIKLDNFLFDNDGTVRLGDFGSTRQHNDNVKFDADRSRMPQTDLTFTPPEWGAEALNHLYNMDRWRLGIALLQLYSPSANQFVLDNLVSIRTEAPADAMKDSFQQLPGGSWALKNDWTTRSNYFTAGIEKLREFYVAENMPEAIQNVFNGLFMINPNFRMANDEALKILNNLEIDNEKVKKQFRGLTQSNSPVQNAPAPDYVQVIPLRSKQAFPTTYGGVSDSSDSSESSSSGKKEEASPGSPQSIIVNDSDSVKSNSISTAEVYGGMPSVSQPNADIVSTENFLVGNYASVPINKSHYASIPRQSEPMERENSTEQNIAPVVLQDPGVFISRLNDIKKTYQASSQDQKAIKEFLTGLKILISDFPKFKNKDVLGLRSCRIINRMHQIDDGYLEFHQNTIRTQISAVINPTTANNIAFVLSTMQAILSRQNNADNNELRDASIKDIDASPSLLTAKYTIQDQNNKILIQKNLETYEEVLNAVNNEIDLLFLNDVKIAIEKANNASRGILKTKNDVAKTMRQLLDKTKQLFALPVSDNISKQYEYLAEQVFRVVLEAEIKRGKTDAFAKTLPNLLALPVSENFKQTDIYKTLVSNQSKPQTPSRNSVAELSIPNTLASMAQFTQDYIGVIHDQGLPAAESVSDKIPAQASNTDELKSVADKKQVEDQLMLIRDRLGIKDARIESDNLRGLAKEIGNFNTIPNAKEVSELLRGLKLKSVDQIDNRLVTRLNWLPKIAENITNSLNHLSKKTDQDDYKSFTIYAVALKNILTEQNPDLSILSTPLTAAEQKSLEGFIQGVKTNYTAEPTLHDLAVALTDSSLNVLDKDVVTTLRAFSNAIITIQLLDAEHSSNVKANVAAITNHLSTDITSINFVNTLHTGLIKLNKALRETAEAPSATPTQREKVKKLMRVNAVVSRHLLPLHQHLNRLQKVIPDYANIQQALESFAEAAKNNPAEQSYEIKLAVHHLTTSLKQNPWDEAKLLLNIADLETQLEFFENSQDDEAMSEAASHFRTEIADFSTTLLATMQDKTFLQGIKNIAETTQKSFSGLTLPATKKNAMTAFYDSSLNLLANIPESAEIYNIRERFIELAFQTMLIHAVNNNAPLETYVKLNEFTKKYSNPLTDKYAELFAKNPTDTVRLQEALQHSRTLAPIFVSDVKSNLTEISALATTKINVSTVKANIKSLTDEMANVYRNANGPTLKPATTALISMLNGLAITASSDYDLQRLMLSVTKTRKALNQLLSHPSRVYLLDALLLEIKQLESEIKLPASRIITNRQSISGTVFNDFTNSLSMQHLPLKNRLVKLAAELAKFQAPKYEGLAYYLHDLASIISNNKQSFDLQATIVNLSNVLSKETTDASDVDLKLLQLRNELQDKRNNISASAIRVIEAINSLLTTNMPINKHFATLHRAFAESTTIQSLPNGRELTGILESLSNDTNLSNVPSEQFRNQVEALHMLLQSSESYPIELDVLHKTLKNIVADETFVPVKSKTTGHFEMEKVSLNNLTKVDPDTMQHFKTATEAFGRYAQEQRFLQESKQALNELHTAQNKFFASNAAKSAAMDKFRVTATKLLSLPIAESVKQPFADQVFLTLMHVEAKKVEKSEKSTNPNEVEMRDFKDEKLTAPIRELMKLPVSDKVKALDIYSVNTDNQESINAVEEIEAEGMEVPPSAPKENKIIKIPTPLQTQKAMDEYFISATQESLKNAQADAEKIPEFLDKLDDLKKLPISREVTKTVSAIKTNAPVDETTKMQIQNLQITPEKNRVVNPANQARMIATKTRLLKLAERFNANSILVKNASAAVKASANQLLGELNTLIDVIPININIPAFNRALATFDEDINHYELLNNDLKFYDALHDLSRLLNATNLDDGLTTNISAQLNYFHYWLTPLHTIMLYLRDELHDLKLGTRDDKHKLFMLFSKLIEQLNSDKSSRYNPQYNDIKASARLLIGSLDAFKLQENNVVTKTTLVNNLDDFIKELRAFSNNAIDVKELRNELTTLGAKLSPADIQELGENNTNSDYDDESSVSDEMRSDWSDDEEEEEQSTNSALKQLVRTLQRLDIYSNDDLPRAIALFSQSLDDPEVEEITAAARKLNIALNDYELDESSDKKNAVKVSVQSLMDVINSQPAFVDKDFNNKLKKLEFLVTPIDEVLKTLLINIERLPDNIKGDATTFQRLKSRFIAIDGQLSEQDNPAIKKSADFLTKTINLYFQSRNLNDHSALQSALNAFIRTMKSIPDAKMTDEIDWLTQSLNDLLMRITSTKVALISLSQKLDNLPQELRDPAIDHTALTSAIRQLGTELTTRDEETPAAASLKTRVVDLYNAITPNLNDVTVLQPLVSATRESLLSIAGHDLARDQAAKALQTLSFKVTRIDYLFDDLAAAFSTELNTNFKDAQHDQLIGSVEALNNVLDSSPAFYPMHIAIGELIENLKKLTNTVDSISVTNAVNVKNSIVKLTREIATITGHNTERDNFLTQLKTLELKFTTMNEVFINLTNKFANLPVDLKSLDLLQKLTLLHIDPGFEARNKQRTNIKLAVDTLMKKIDAVNNADSTANRDALKNGLATFNDAITNSATGLEAGVTPPPPARNNVVAQLNALINKLGGLNAHPAAASPFSFSGKLTKLAETLSASQIKLKVPATLIADLNQQLTALAAKNIPSDQLRELAANVITALAPALQTTAEITALKTKIAAFNAGMIASANNTTEMQMVADRFEMLAKHLDDVYNLRKMAEYVDAELTPGSAEKLKALNAVDRLMTGLMDPDRFLLMDKVEHTNNFFDAVLAIDPSFPAGSDMRKALDSDISKALQTVKSRFGYEYQASKPLLTEEERRQVSVTISVIDKQITRLESMTEFAVDSANFRKKEVSIKNQIENIYFTLLNLLRANEQTKMRLLAEGNTTEAGYMTANNRVIDQLLSKLVSIEGKMPFSTQTEVAIVIGRADIAKITGEFTTLEAAIENKLLELGYVREGQDPRAQIIAQDDLPTKIALVKPTEAEVSTVNIRTGSIGFRQETTVATIQKTQALASDPSKITRVELTLLYKPQELGRQMTRFANKDGYLSWAISLVEGIRNKSTKPIHLYDPLPEDLVKQMVKYCLHQGYKVHDHTKYGYKPSKSAIEDVGTKLQSDPTKYFKNLDAEQAKFLSEGKVKTSEIEQDTQARADAFKAPKPK